MWIDVIFVKVLQLRQKVFFIHESLRRVPPVFLKDFTVFFLRCFLALTIAHNAYSVQDLPNAIRWRMQDSDFVDVGGFYCIERIIRLL